jgi:hypothetical protein
MSLCNDGLVVCDACRGLLVPDPAAVVELWPEWRHDPGFHVCLGCLRRAYADQYLADIAAMDSLHRERQAAVTGPRRAAPLPPRPELASCQPIPEPRQEGLTMNASQMAAYVVGEAERLTGPQLRVPGAEEIFEGFIERFGRRDATRIAKAAIDVHRGMWVGAPITPRRFLPGHDGFFARPILALLDGQGQSGAP